MNAEKLNSSLKRAIATNRRRAYCLLYASIFVEVILITVTAVKNTREDWFVFLILEAILLIVFKKFVSRKTQGIFRKDIYGVIVEKKIDRSIDRKGAIGGMAYTGWVGKIDYYIVISPNEQETNVKENEIKIHLPNKDSFLSYEVGDEVVFPAIMMLPVITNRIPERRICPSCGSFIHIEDGTCHKCGLSNVYPN